jgi:O-antigen/teichoic acid export membrane protein
MAFVLATALFNAWGPLVLSHSLGDRWAFTARTGTVLTTVVAMGGAGVALLGPWLVALMARGDFDRPAMVTALGWLAGVAAFYMVYQGSSLAVLDSERTGRLAWAALVALGVLVALAVALAPTWGIAGIAAAKLVGYGILAVLTTWFAVRHSALRWGVRVWLVVGAAVVVSVLAGGLLPLSGPGAWVRLALAGLVAAGGLVLAPKMLRTLRG